MASFAAMAIGMLPTLGTRRRRLSRRRTTRKVARVVRPPKERKPRSRISSREKFDEFTFSPTGLSVFHLGDFGTALEKLKKAVVGL